ncbi:hypothetical protein HU200_065798 [Digitaria exilis]|uniref:Uncharacterized protein n=1 Tax=Digitaria exilis TaxID=1010633 RepID=A0A835A3D9_9POAL|nr:hypothetical protein HU200_065798 [Digitaria exilis]CAB3483556.1 unnamed protein product [Digitaria exilis]
MSPASKFEFDSCSFTYQFKLNLEETKDFPIGKPISSGDIFAGGHLWRINCFPRGDREENNGEYISVFLCQESETQDAKAIFEVFVMDTDGAPSSTHRHKIVHVYTPKGSYNGNSRGWSKFVPRSELESLFVSDDSVIIMCGVKVVHDDPNPISVPPSDIKTHLGILLDSGENSDVSFIVDGEEFPAHRAVLAARSPVFKAQLEDYTNMPSSITLQDITPVTFKVMLRFIYTDDLVGDVELSNEMFQDLLAAADRYALDRLKLMCVQKLWDDVSMDTVASTLACAKTYNCPELKTKCIDFFADESNFKKVVLTEGFVQLVQKFPAILTELRAKVGA